MSFDENEFVRQITLRLFSNLKVEEAMVDCFQYLQPAIPADLIFMQYFKLDTGTNHLLAAATVEEGRSLDIALPFSPEARQRVETSYNGYKKGPGVVINNHPELDLDYRPLLDFFKRGDTSSMVMVLNIGDMVLGSVAVFADRHDRYTEEHARLFSLLKEPFSIAIYNTEIYREVLRLRDMLIDDNKLLHRELHRISGERIIGEEFGLGPVMEMVRQVAPSESPVLLLGETGTGKDVIAHAVHQASEHRNGPFIAVNCGAIPETLIDSELFGHEKGSFTGALSQKRGRFERADKGTIFLDEIGEMPPSAQVRLLRVLQNKEIERVGGVTPIPLDIRIIAATNRDLDKMVEENQFRQDLMFRLNVFPIKIPPLRERIGDIPALAQYILQKKTRELKIQRTPKLAERALEQLESYDWPGNVRELENVIERALLLNPEGPLEFSHLVSIDRGRNKNGTLKKNNVSMRLDDVLSNHIRSVLQQVSGKVHGPGGAAEILGVNPSTLRGKMRKLGIFYGKNK